MLKWFRFVVFLAAATHAVATFALAGQETQSKLLVVQSIRAMRYDPITAQFVLTSDLFDPRQAVRRYRFDDARKQSDPPSFYEMSLGSPVSLIEVQLTVSSSLRHFGNSMIIKLDVQGTSSGKLKQTQNVNLAMFTSSARERTLYIPFLIYDESCEELKLNLTVFDKERTYDTKSRIIPFSCGE